MDASGRHEFPEDPFELAKLAFLLGHADVEKLSAEVSEMFCKVRSLFLRVFESAMG